MDKEKQIDLLQEIIEHSYKLLINKISFGGLIVNSEATFQLELGYILKTLGQLHEFSAEDKFNLFFEYTISLEEISAKGKKPRVDIVLRYKDVIAAIELKFFKKENHREPNNRCDAFKDLRNLELYKKSGIDICFFIMGTDHIHYVNQESYSFDTSDFDMRDGKMYHAGSEMKYNTKTPYIKEPLILDQNYVFRWDRIERSNLYFLKVKI
ncbi:MAG: hypothetical protein LUH63_09345 [Parabacteroides sp.]|nr:hypothetical protein [Parabacteroides sp.]